MIKGLIFDCDGTLADTMPLHWRAWQAITERHRIHLPEDRFYSLGAVPSRDILRMLSAEQGLALDHLAAAGEKEAEYLPLIELGLKAIRAAGMEAVDVRKLTVRR